MIDKGTRETCSSIVCVKLSEEKKGRTDKECCERESNEYFQMN